MTCSHAPEPVRAATAAAGWLCCLLALAPTLADGSDCTLQGTVTDAVSGRPLLGCEVTLQSATGALSRGVTSSTGRYRFEGLSTGLHTLSLAELPRYETPVPREVRLHEGVPARADFALCRLRPHVTAQVVRPGNDEPVGGTVTGLLRITYQPGCYEPTKLWVWAYNPRRNTSSFIIHDEQFEWARYASDIADRVDVGRDRVVCLRFQWVTIDLQNGRHRLCAAMEASNPFPADVPRLWPVRPWHRTQR